MNDPAGPTDEAIRRAGRVQLRRWIDEAAREGTSDVLDAIALHARRLDDPLVRRLIEARGEAAAGRLSANAHLQGGALARVERTAARTIAAGDAPYRAAHRWTRALLRLTEAGYGLVEPVCDELVATAANRDHPCRGHALRVVTHAGSEVGEEALRTMLDSGGWSPHELGLIAAHHHASPGLVRELLERPGGAREPVFRAIADRRMLLDDPALRGRLQAEGPLEVVEGRIGEMGEGALARLVRRALEEAGPNRAAWIAAGHPERAAREIEEATWARLLEAARADARQAVLRVLARREGETPSRERGHARERGPTAPDRPPGRRCTPLRPRGRARDADGCARHR